MHATPTSLVRPRLWLAPTASPTHHPLCVSRADEDEEVAATGSVDEESMIPESLSGMERGVEEEGETGVLVHIRVSIPGLWGGR